MKLTPEEAARIAGRAGLDTATPQRTELLLAAASRCVDVDAVCRGAFDSTVHPAFTFEPCTRWTSRI